MPVNRFYNESSECWMVYCQGCEDYHWEGEELCAAVSPRKEYTIISDHGESSNRVAIFSRAEVEKVYGPIESLKAEDIINYLVGWYASSNGPGRWFRSEPSIRLMKRNVVIRQFGGLDI